MGQSILRYIIGSSRIKYEVLDELYKPIMGRVKKCHSAVMLVDAHAIFCRLQQKRNLEAYEESVDDGITDMTVGFLNVLGHYRRYLATRLGLDNVIHVFFNRSGSAYHRALVPDYGIHVDKTYAVGLFENSIERSWEFIRGLSPYFEGIYCMDAGGVDVHSLMGKLNPPQKTGVLCVIFSGSEHTLQLVGGNTVQLTNSRDRSKLITGETCMEYLLGETAARLRSTHGDAVSVLKPGLLPLMWSFAGCKSMDVPPLEQGVGLGKIARRILRALANGRIGTSPSLGTLCSSLGFAGREREVESRLRALHIGVSAGALTGDQLARIRSQIYDIYDGNRMEELNEMLAEVSINPELLDIGNLNMSNSMVH